MFFVQKNKKFQNVVVASLRILELNEKLDTDCSNICNKLVQRFFNYTYNGFENNISYCCVNDSDSLAPLCNYFIIFNEPILSAGN
jgi:hypothetical protein